jgi:hypothetical protein
MDRSRGEEKGTIKEYCDSKCESRTMGTQKKTFSKSRCSFRSETNGALSETEALSRLRERIALGGQQSEYPLLAKPCDFAILKVGMSRLYEVDTTVFMCTSVQVVWQWSDTVQRLMLRYPNTATHFFRTIHVTNTIYPLESGHLQSYLCTTIKLISVQGYLLVLPPPMSCPSRYPAILSHSIFCLVIGNCLLNPLNAPSLKLLKPLLTSSWYFFSATAISRTIEAAEAEAMDADMGFVVRRRTLPSS